MAGLLMCLARARVVVTSQAEEGEGTSHCLGQPLLWMRPQGSYGHYLIMSHYISGFLILSK
jgi:hypothetical protein